MPSGWAAPGGNVANRVAGVRNHAWAGGASNATARSAAISTRLTSFIGVASWSDGVDGRAGTVSRRRRFRAGVAEDAGRAKGGDALRRIVCRGRVQKACDLGAVGGVGRRGRGQARG